MSCVGCMRIKLLLAHLKRQMTPLAVVERISEQMYRTYRGRVGNLIALTRYNLHELEAIERLASFLGTDRFGALALQLAYEYPVENRRTLPIHT